MAVPENIVELFAQHDKLGCGIIDRSALIQILSQLGCCGECDADRLVKQYKLAKRDVLHYKEFFRWLFRDDGLDAKANCALAELSTIADNLESVATSLAPQLPDITSTLLSQVESLRGICSQFPGAPIETTTSWADDVFRNEPLDGEVDASDGSQFRKQAVVTMERTGPRGSVVDDLEEIPACEAKDTLALTYFRFCDGLKLYRSASVSKAMRLICSAPVPGLGKTTYMEVFRVLTKQRWQSHIYVKGGLVRDILRRNIGADVDISFSAPVNELGAICHQQGWPCGYWDCFNYIYIGNKSGEEYLEGMAIHHEGSEPDFHADFSMNTLLYDFCNDVVIDRYGIGLPAVIHNRVDIPRVRDKWDAWVARKGLQALFRYYKFLLRGYTYEESEMTYIVDRLLGFWAKDAANTVKEGRIALDKMVGCTDPSKIKSLQKWVYTSFEKASSRADPKGGGGAEGSDGCFSSAGLWWQHGWLPMLKIEGSY